MSPTDLPQDPDTPITPATSPDAAVTRPVEVEAGPAGRRTMRAIIQLAYGDADTWTLGEIDRPAIGPRDVLVDVRAAGLDRGTWHLMAGLPYAARLACGLRAPKQVVPGLDLAGVVVSVGGGVTRFAPGDEVVGIGRGSFAEFAAAPEDKLAHKPASLTFEAAAALPVSGLTALQGLRDAGRLDAGQHVLILGASGGVGSYAVQIAKAMGAVVTGACSTAKLDLVRSLGADHVIDYSAVDALDGQVRYDLIFDIGGNASLTRLRRALAKTGTLVVVGGEGGGRVIGGFDRGFRALVWSPFVKQRLTMVMAKEHHDDLERLIELVEAGKVAPAIGRTYPLASAPQAMADLVAGRARGKLVITV